MSSDHQSRLLDQMEQQVRTRTGRRVRNLAIELQPQRIILRGQATSYYIKQLAQHGLRDLCPDLSVENSIVVEDRRDAVLNTDWL